MAFDAREQDSGSSPLDLITYGMSGLSWGSDAALDNFLKNRQVGLAERLVEEVKDTPERIGAVLAPHLQDIAGEVINLREAEGEKHIEAMAHAEAMTNDIVLAVQEGVNRIVASQAEQGTQTREAIKAFLENAVQALCYCVSKMTEKVIDANLTSPRRALLRILNRDDTVFTVPNITSAQEDSAQVETLFSSADLELVNLFLQPGGAEIFIRNTVKNDPDTLLLFLEVETEDPDWNRAKKTAFERILKLALTPLPGDTENDMQMASVDHLFLLLVHAQKYEVAINEMAVPAEGSNEKNYYRTRLYETLRQIGYGDVDIFNTAEQTQAQRVLHAAGKLSPTEKKDLEGLFEVARKMSSQR